MSKFQGRRHGRWSHWLRPLKPKGRVEWVVVLDTETRAKGRERLVLHELRVWVAWFGVWDPEGKLRRVATGFGTTMDDFWSWLDDVLPKKKTTYIFAHRLAFDSLVLGVFTKSSEYGWELRAWGEGKHGTWWVLRRGQQALVGVDTWAWLRTSLERIAEYFGLSKLRVDPLVAPDPEWGDVLELRQLGGDWQVQEGAQDILSYCYRDVEILWRAVEWLLGKLEEWGGGPIRVGPATQAWVIWRSRFLNHPLLVHNDPQALALARDATYGGRAEIFRWGPQSEGPWVDADLEMAYVRVARDCPLPWRFKRYFERSSLPWLESYITWKGVVAEVLIETEEPLYPLRWGDRLLFPVGRFWTVLPGPELLVALEEDAVRDVRRVGLWDLGPLLHDWASWLLKEYEEAAADNDWLALAVLKAMGRGMIGRLAMRQRRWEWHGLGDPEKIGRWTWSDPETGEAGPALQLPGGFWRCRQDGEADNVVPEVFAWVTSYVRVELVRAIRTLGWDRVGRVDTDCIVFRGTEEDIERIQAGAPSWARWRRKKTAAQVTFWLPKWYEWDGAVIAAGFPRGSLQPGAKWVSLDLLQGIAETVSRGVLDGAILIRQNLELRRIYDARRVAPDGSTRPLVFTVRGHQTEQVTDVPGSTGPSPAPGSAMAREGVVS